MSKMRVFVAGATGVLGRTLLPRLVSAGHEVIGLGRTAEKLLEIVQLGGTPERGDILDANVMRGIVERTRPDAIVNLATAIPLKLRVTPKDWELNDRIRTEGTRNLLEASQAANVRLFVQESVGYVCAPHATAWLDENAPLSPHPFLRATQQMEAQIKASGIPSVILRLAAVMASESWHFQQSVVALRRGLLPIVGDGSPFVSLIHADDAAQSIQRSLESPAMAAGKIYNVVDNEPAPMREVLTYAAQCLHASAPRQVPAFMAKMVVGSLTLEVFTASYRMTNAKIRQELGFVPRSPSYRELWHQLSQEIAGKEFVASSDLT